MSIFEYLSESLKSVNEMDLSSDMFDDEEGSEEKVVSDEEGSEEKVVSDEDSDKSEAQEMVDAIIKSAPGQSKAIKNMLKYAANSNEDYDVFDSALDYYESIEDSMEQEDEAPVEDKEMVDKPSAPVEDEESLGDDEEFKM